MTITKARCKYVRLKARIKNEFFNGKARLFIEKFCASLSFSYYKSTTDVVDIVTSVRLLWTDSRSSCGLSVGLSPHSTARVMINIHCRELYDWCRAVVCCHYRLYTNYSHSSTAQAYSTFKCSTEKWLQWNFLYFELPPTWFCLLHCRLLSVCCRWRLLFVTNSDRLRAYDSSRGGCGAIWALV